MLVFLSRAAKCIYLSQENSSNGGQQNTIEYLIGLYYSKIIGRLIELIVGPNSFFTCYTGIRYMYRRTSYDLLLFLLPIAIMILMEYILVLMICYTQFLFCAPDVTVFPEAN